MKKRDPKAEAKAARAAALKEATVVPEEMQAAVGKPVSYYAEGWRVGYLDGFTKMGAARIQPVSALNGTKPNMRTIPLADIKLIGAVIPVHDTLVEIPEPAETKPTKTPDQLKCKSADKYQGKRKPQCNGGNPCQACLAKYKEVQAKKVEAPLQKAVDDLKEKNDSDRPVQRVSVLQRLRDAAILSRPNSRVL